MIDRSTSMAYFSAKPGPRPFYLSFSDVPEPWSELHALADRHRGAFASAFAAAHGKLIAGIDHGELVRAVAMGSAAHAEHALGLHRLHTYLLTELRPVYRRLFARAGDLADRHLTEGRHQSRAFADEVGISSQFDRTNQSAVDWIDRNVGVLVQDISSAQRRMLVQMVNDAFTQGIEPARLARQIRERIGLTATQQGYVTNYRAQLEARGTIKDDWVDKLVGRYQDNWVKYRAMTIARTETIRTAIAGQQELWGQSVTSGRIDPVEYEQLWIITPDDLTCDDCREYNGERAPIGGAFMDGVAGPPLHPRCRCAVGLIAVASAKRQQAVPDMAPQGPSKLIPRIPQSAMAKGASEWGYSPLRQMYASWWANKVWREARYRTLEAMGFAGPEDEERDERGRWTSGGGGDSKQENAGVGESHGGPSGVTWTQPVDATGRPIPIKVETVEAAVPLVLAGKVVEVPTEREAYTLIEKLAQVAKEDQASGKGARDFDLCNVTVSGSSMFCAQSLRTKEYPNGVPRLDMPQLGGKPLPGTEADKLPRNPWDPTEVDGAKQFISYLQGVGIRTSTGVIPAENLRASQAELVGTKVAGMMDDKTFQPATNPIFISRDNYIVDGHHRWAAVVGRDLESGAGHTNMNYIRVDAPISEVLHIANAWSTKFGIAQAAGPKTHSEWMPESILWERLSFAGPEDEERDEHGRWTSGGGGGGEHPEPPGTGHQAERSILSMLKATNGFSYSPASDRFQMIGANGYAVSPYESREQTFDRPVTRADLHTFMAKNADLLSKPDHYVGGWRDTDSGKVFLDVSIVVGDRGHAATIAAEHNQYAIFDFHTGESIDTSGSSHRAHTERDGRGARPLPRHRQWLGIFG